MNLDNIDERLRHLFREQEQEIDFRKIAAAKTAPPSPEVIALFGEQHEARFENIHDLLESKALGIDPPTWVKVASLTKGTITATLAKTFIRERGAESAEARHALSLAVYYDRHPDGGITERLRALADKAKTLLPNEEGELLEKALKALDMYIVAACFEKAFLGVAA
jgi:hypothetical protein